MRTDIFIKVTWCVSTIQLAYKLICQGGSAMKDIMTFQTHQYKEHKALWKKTEESSPLAHLRHNLRLYKCHGDKSSSQYWWLSLEMSIIGALSLQRSPSLDTFVKIYCSTVASNPGFFISHKRLAFIRSYPALISTGRVFLRNCFGSLFGQLMQFGYGHLQFIFLLTISMHMSYPLTCKKCIL